MSRPLVNREELGRLIARTSSAFTVINESNYRVRSKTGNNTSTVIATKSGWACSCPDYARHNAKCKHVYAVEFYRRHVTYVWKYNKYVLVCPDGHEGSYARPSH